MKDPLRPMAVVLGGAKVKDKIGVVDAVIRKADIVIIGGRMAFTFLAACGVAARARSLPACLSLTCVDVPCLFRCVFRWLSFGSCFLELF